MAITIPNLTDRKEDILPFVEDYFSRHRERFASQVTELAPDVQELFLQYDWPGNLKELELLLDEIVSFMTTETTVTSDLLPLHFRFKVQQQDTNNREPEFLCSIKIIMLCHSMPICVKPNHIMCKMS